ncbi:MAG: bifunctional SulP family inorganic anion transporter/carbonic anhydrase [Legionellaceae bacterium]|nr:bifunctional SulP family inorganic anion transporter/carbonic anhydrase [Legionellaceae bacterium]
MSQIFSRSLQQFSSYGKKDFKSDLLASIVVFLIAIPLCLGIALASGAPLFSGIISGVIGGLIVGLASGSHVSVSGPAAGMAAVVVTAITQLGDFNVFLLALCLAGLIQISIGALRAGFIAEYVPSNVVQGLLSAIGLLLIVKQLPIAATHPVEYTRLKLDLLEATQSFSLKPLAYIQSHFDYGALIISLLSLTLLIAFDKIRNKKFKIVPAPILVVIVGIVINEIYLRTGTDLTQDSVQLVNIPEYHGLPDLIGQLQFPNWASWLNPKVYLYAFVLAIVASLESLLNVKAGEKLDKRKRHCSKDRELIAQGLGNLSAGFIGGIPVTSVIVRTTVNIEAGARSKVSAILHGFFLLLAIFLIPKYLNKIPLAALAAILIHTGYKLSKPAIFRSIYQQGWDRFIPFMVTVIGIVFYDLLTGILCGLAVSLFYILKTSSQARLDIIQEVYPNGISNRLMLPQQVTFLNRGSLFAELDALPANSQLILDARYTTYMDKEIIDLLQGFEQNEAKEKNIGINLMGFKDHYDIHDHIDFINVTTYDIQSNLSARQVLNILQEGNQRFCNDTRIHRNPKMEIQHTSDTQHPIAIIVTCIDSRVPVETIFDMTFGDLFCIRIAGNVVSPDVLASIEYACHVAGAKLIVVLGHTRCGAIMSACDQFEKGNITQLLQKINPALAAEQQTQGERNSNNKQFVQRVTEFNIANTLQRIYQESTILKTMTDAEEIAMIGAVYDVASGKVAFKDYSVPMQQLATPSEPTLLNSLRKLSHFVEPEPVTS